MNMSASRDLTGLPRRISFQILSSLCWLPRMDGTFYFMGITLRVVKGDLLMNVLTSFRD